MKNCGIGHWVIDAHVLLGVDHMKFEYTQLKFIIKAIDDINIPPYKGSALRGGFGNVLRNTVCITKDNSENACHECNFRNQCAYTHIFSNVIKEEAIFTSKYGNAPSPFVIQPPIEKETHYSSGDDIEFSINLFGEGIEYTSYFIYAFDRLGDVGLGKGRGKYKLLKVLSFEKEIFSSEHEDKDFMLENITKRDLYDLYISQIFGQDYNNVKNVTIEFLTPARLKVDSGILNRFELEKFIKILLRRITIMLYYHCGEVFDYDNAVENLGPITVESELTNENLKLEKLNRYSSRTNSRMSIWGTIGSVSLKNVDSRLVKLLQLGEIVHVGKAVSFGFGQIKVTISDC